MHKLFKEQGVADEIIVTPKAANGAKPVEAKAKPAIAKFASRALSADTKMLSKAGTQALGVVTQGSNWGANPHGPPPGRWALYNPQYIAILYLGLDASWNIVVNHACFTPTANDEAGRLAQAVDILKDKIANGWELGDPNLRHYGTYHHQWPAPTAGHQVNHDHDSMAFTDFNFYSQNELFIFIHDSDIMLADGDVLGFKPQGVSPQPKDFNSSYFNARVVPPEDLDTLANKGKMIRVENYATLEDGTLIGNAHRNYSMDIKFRVDGGAAGMITMIIDPDTGNGAGNEP